MVRARRFGTGAGVVALMTDSEATLGDGRRAGGDSAGRG